MVVDTGYRHNQIMESLECAGCSTMKHDREPARQHGVRMGDVRYVMHTHLPIAMPEDELFPMNTTFY